MHAARLQRKTKIPTVDGDATEDRSVAFLKSIDVDLHFINQCKTTSSSVFATAAPMIAYKAATLARAKVRRFCNRETIRSRAASDFVSSSIWRSRDATARSKARSFVQHSLS
jgi:hypothetical protein